MKSQNTSVKTFAIISLLAISMLLPSTGCGGRATLARLSAPELMEIGLDRYDNEKYATAIGHFEQLIYNFPGYGGVDSAQYFLALSYYGTKNYVVAEVEFNRLLLNYPSSEFTTRAQFLKAVCSFEGTPSNAGLDQSELASAIRQFEDFIVDHPESEYAADAQSYLDLAQSRLAKKDYKAGVVYFRINALTAAEIYFQRVVDEYTATDYAANAAFYLAEIAEKRDEFQQASQRYAAFRTAYPDHEWVGDATERQVETAWKAIEQAMRDSDWVRAELRLLEFKQDFPNDPRQDEIDSLLREVETNRSQAPQVNADS